MARQSTGSQRKSSSKAVRNVIPGGPGYFRRAVERGATRGQMRAYGKPINAIVATGTGVEIRAVYNVPLSQRREIMEHWNLVQDVLKAKNATELKRAERKLARYTHSHPNTGGVEPGEFASDIRDIVRANQADADAFNDDNRYPKET